MTTGLFLLRCCQVGLSIADLSELTVGMVNDMFIELHNDDFNYPVMATQEDINAI